MRDDVKFLCKKCAGGSRWYPVSVGKYDNLVSSRIRRTTGIPNGYAIRKNIAYNLQHLEYLAQTLDQLTLSAVMLTQTYKTFIITGASIFEAVFWFLIKEAGYHKTIEWALVNETTSAPYPVGGKEHRTVTSLFERLQSPADDEMSFEKILRIVEKKKLLGATSKFYGQLHHLRKLRNKVHLHVTSHDLDTDWNAFQFRDFELMKALLLDLFTGNLFGPTKEEREYFTFLAPRSSI